MPARWTDAMRFLKNLVTSVGLAGVYYFVVTPLAWWVRVRGREALALRREPRGSSYWVPLDIDSMDRTVYLDYDDPSKVGRSRERRLVVQAYRRLAAATPLPAKWLILLTLFPWTRFASSPEGDELRSDLYVLF